MDNGFEAVKDNQGIYEDCKLAEKMISGTTRVEILTALRSYGTAFEKMVNALILKAGITQEQILKIKKQEKRFIYSKDLHVMKQKQHWELMVI